MTDAMIGGVAEVCRTDREGITVEVCVPLLEEAIPTVRGTTAIAMGGEFLCAHAVRNDDGSFTISEELKDEFGTK